MMTIVPQATIESATLADVALLARLGSVTYEETFVGVSYYTQELVRGYTIEAFAEERIAAALRDPFVHYLIARVGSRAVGYAKLEERDAPACVTQRAIYLGRIYLAKDAQGHGLGTQLLEETFNRSRSLGYRWLWLSVWEHNVAAINFYRGKKFQEVGEWEWKFSSLGRDYCDRDLVMCVDLEARDSADP